MVAVNIKRFAIIALALLAAVGCDKSKGSRNTVGTYNYSNGYTNNARAAYENCDLRLYQAQPQTRLYEMCDQVKTGNICSILDVHMGYCPQVQRPANYNDPNYYTNLKNVYFDYLNRQDQNSVYYMTNAWNQLIAQYTGSYTGQQPYPAQYPNQYRP